MRVYLGLGSNLAGPLRQVRAALAFLQTLERTRLHAVSSLYRSAPLGPAGQPDYINAVAAIDSLLAPLDLLDRLQARERVQGRVRGERWGARTIDLDILLYGDASLDSARLQVPHPEMTRRAFVLVPLHEIAGDIAVPGQGSLESLLAACPRGDIERILEVPDMPPGPL